MMVPDSEMWKVISAAQAYRQHVISDQLREIVQKVQADLPTDSIKKNGDSFLDDKFNFRGNNYRVRDILVQMERGSDIGLRFAQAVYQTAQNRLRQAPNSLGIFNYSDAIKKVTHPKTK